MSLDEIELIEEANVRQRAISAQALSRPIVGTILAALSKDGQRAAHEMESQARDESVKGLQIND